MADYNAKAVDDAIAASNRSGKRIGGKERKLIHALLQGRKPIPAKSNPKTQAIYLIKARWDRASYYWNEQHGFTGSLRNASDFPSVAAANKAIKRIPKNASNWNEIRVIRLDEAKKNPKRKVTRVKRNPTFGKRKRVAGASIRRHFIIELLHKDYGVWYVNAVGKASINRKSANHFVAKADAERNMKSFLAHMPHNVKKNFVWIRTVPA